MYKMNINNKKQTREPRSARLARRWVRRRWVRRRAKKYVPR